MYKYILKRILLMIPVILGVIMVIFFIMDLSPTDAVDVIGGTDMTQEEADAMREDMGLNRPFIVRYGDYVLSLLRGDMGKSWKNNRSIAGEIFSRLPNTVLLAGSAIMLACLIGIPVGIISAKKQYSILDNVVTVFALIGAAVPVFWLGLVGVLLFAVHLKWFPPAGMGKTVGEVIRSLVLPAVAISTTSIAIFTRQTRSSMLDVMRQDYINTARGKGVSERKITTRHMLKNALIPIITAVGLQFGVLLGGSVITENVFAWPGLGRYVVDSISNRDTPAVLGCVVTISLMFSLMNLLTDILYSFVDPRIKSQYTRKTVMKAKLTGTVTSGGGQQNEE